MINREKSLPIAGLLLVYVECYVFADSGGCLSLNDGSGRKKEEGEGEEEDEIPHSNVAQL
jgi:hypothetical protein